MTKEERLMAGFRNVYNKMVYLNNLKMKDCFDDYTSTEVHVLEYIGTHTDSNVTALADAFFMTRGAISKITRKLMQKGSVESYQRPGNRKEVYFRLTPVGRGIFDTHEGLHEEFRKRDEEIFAGLGAQQLEDMLCFLERYERHLDEEKRKLEEDSVGE